MNDTYFMGKGEVMELKEREREEGGVLGRKREGRQEKREKGRKGLIYSKLGRVSCFWMVFYLSFYLKFP